MRLATFNVENLFDRAVAMNTDDMTKGKKVLAAHEKFNRRIQEAKYTSDDKQDMLGLLKDLGILYRNNQGALRIAKKPEFAILRENRGDFLKEPKDAGKSVEIVATGRGSWIGWAELLKKPVDEIATRNTARVIRDIAPDVIGVVEAEHRPGLQRFNLELLSEMNGAFYGHAMVIDGNDPRGIDIGIMTRPEFEIVTMRTHVDDVNPGGELTFSRDCPEYEIRTKSGETLWLLINHLKSRGYRGKRDPDDVRRDQAKQVRKIYDALRAKGAKHVAVMGDLNDSPGHDPLEPLLKNGSDLKDVSESQAFESDGIPGTYGRGYADNKFDYILLCPELLALVTKAGVYRKGVWDDRQTPKWEMYDNMKKSVHAASDHALLWVDLNL